MINIRKMSYEDIDQMVIIEQKNFSNPWSKNSFVQELNNNLATYFVACDKERVIGYGGIWYIIDEGHITNIVVDEKYQRQGIGQQIVENILKVSKEKNIKRCTLEVRVSNKAAIALYNKLGFVQLGIRKNYYTNPTEHAIIMWKEIS
ncbi:[SSU ribosomal protein S18P]-alanine acetyltransferase [Natranaerovirga hydrolytica]|uniref:[Ribosomal protein bS18]-alanine N-acetyltransferase n=1 Tax=Natranaerovirga hydrolytica TaxID=680378 RepID=A0A4R1MD31_9FIRM|nr:ribosomal protein S18-alanine N-acetyltransferase [Natranaerovirga hydrolytica]TCK87939.1 [SSU ribosomal protein S18P]-alanine acetyltransferase [Natranaerovirga hydrolytica]